MEPSKRKGKARAAQPSETDSLLGSSYQADSPVEYSPRTPTAARLPRQTCSFLLTAGLVIFSFIFTAMLFVLLLGYSFKPSESEMATLPNTAFVYSHPDSVQVLNITDHGVCVNVTVRMGIDADLALGTKRYDGDSDGDPTSRGDRGQGVGWWEWIRRWTARQALAQLPQQAINVVFPHHIAVHRVEHSSAAPLLSVRVNQSIPVPLVLDADDSKDWLKPVSFLAFVEPTFQGSDMLHYLQSWWMQGQVNVLVSVQSVAVSLPEGVWWSKYGQLEKQDLSLNVKMDIPHLNGLPRPGHQLNLSELVHLDSYHLQTIGTSALGINASATLPNPFAEYDLGLDIPFALPFLISLSDGSAMARVTTSPLRLDSAKALHLSLEGEIIANLMHRNTSSLSTFLQRFLHGQDNPIIVSGLKVPAANPPPQWILEVLPDVAVSLTFPGPQPPPKVIKSVSIEHMRISERAGQFLASGTVVARVELPETMQKIQLDVKGVAPDVLVYNGPAGDEDADPDEPPPNAFGRINPEDFLNSTTAPSDDPLHPYAIIVTAPMTNVPLQVLEGRDGVFRNFASKVVFKGGAEAGIKGMASVKVDLKGVPGRATLEDLPVTGETWVGRQRLSSAEDH
ncbi:hypothetical protein BD324DRAFT_633320 [Kockovaella imperatae]|uniref:Pre-rRNA processing protein n=1 Tax=Kockovaella imperatae TaxID=4999 RepID=A0A1Y1UA84_9TREE|nr:hypothetical protein BD324DRAFT_633320 [Kockovaella imperatae]ORX34943.1 hypothetical protein BD324DRAFT_633320 [Kockovaella imperatae]